MPAAAVRVNDDVVSRTFNHLVVFLREVIRKWRVTGSFGRLITLGFQLALLHKFIEGIHVVNPE